jgi:Domain of unknown function (DUF3471)
MRLYRFPPFFLLAAVVLFSSCKGRSSFTVDAASVTEQLQQITQARLDANLANNREFYERLLVPDFQILYPTSNLRTKRQYMEDGRFLPETAGHRGLKPTIADFHAYVDGETAVATYSLIQHTAFGTQIFDLPVIHLDTYTLRNGEWKLFSMAVVDVPSWPDVANIKVKLYAEYAGTYELAPETTLTVTNEDGRLFAQLSRQDKREWLPENETTFFDKNDGANERLVFERGASGEVVGCVFRTHGQKIRAVRKSK